MDLHVFTDNRGISDELDRELHKLKETGFLVTATQVRRDVDVQLLPIASFGELKEFGEEAILLLVKEVYRSVGIHRFMKTLLEEDGFGLKHFELDVQLTRYLIAGQERLGSRLGSFLKTNRDVVQRCYEQCPDAFPEALLVMLLLVEDAAKLSEVWPPQLLSRDVYRSIAKMLNISIEGL